MTSSRRHWSGAPHILYGLGNHEFYGTEIDETRARLAGECAGAGIHLIIPSTINQSLTIQNLPNPGQIPANHSSQG